MILLDCHNFFLSFCTGNLKEALLEVAKSVEGAWTLTGLFVDFWKERKNHAIRSTTQRTVHSQSGEVGSVDAAGVVGGGFG